MKKLGLVDVARTAGVSTATVSRVLNKSNRVSPETEKKVLAVVQELNFRPDLSASTLRRGRSKTIGIAVASISQPWYGKLIRALRVEVTQRGYTTIVYDLDHQEDMLVEHLENAVALRLAGLVLATGDRLDGERVFSSLESVSHSIPLVVIGQHVESATWATVRFNDLDASRHAASDMVARRNKPLLIMARSSTSYLAQVRVEGTLLALQEHQELLTKSRVVELEGHMSAEEGYRVGHELSDRLGEFGAAICVNDELAIGLSRAAVELGIRIPEDLMVIGYGDIDLLPYLFPSLSSVSGDAQQAAKYGLDALFASIERKPFTTETVIERTIIHRESTGNNSALQSSSNM